MVKKETVILKVGWYGQVAVRAKALCPILVTYTILSPVFLKENFKPITLLTLLWDNQVQISNWW